MRLVNMFHSTHPELYLKGAGPCEFLQHTFADRTVSAPFVESRKVYGPNVLAFFGELETELDEVTCEHHVCKQRAKT